MSEPIGGTWPGEIVVTPDAQSLSETAARFFADKISDAINHRGRATVALSGGGAPPPTYRRLASPPFRDSIPWDKVHVFWGDERFVPSTDAKSNYRLANETLLSQIPIPSANIHRVITEQGSAVEVASRYEQTIRAFFGNRYPAFDLIHLGLGANAHTASLFPHSGALDEKSRLVVANYVEELKTERLTITAPLINNAYAVVFLVSSGDKAEAVRDVIVSPYDPQRLPAQLVRPYRGSLTWLLDAPAARLLPDGQRSPRSRLKR